MNTSSEMKKLSRTDIVYHANKLAAELLLLDIANSVVMYDCLDNGMSQKDGERMEAQIRKIAERLRRA